MAAPRFKGGPEPEPVRLSPSIDPPWVVVHPYNNLDIYTLYKI